jgi:aldose 1-epimerase
MKLRAAIFLLTYPLMAAAPYSAQKAVVDGVQVVRLADTANHVEVAIATSIGNMAYEMKAGGKKVLYSPFRTVAEMKERPRLAGVPFLAPWANRIDGDSFWADGKQYTFNLQLGNLRRDQNQQPIHGLVTFSPAWTVVSAAADERSAHVTSRLEFWRDPALMAQFPFAHNITMTYRLANGELEVETAIENLSNARMPVAIGFHPYFQVEDAPRDEWNIHIAARDHVVLNPKLTPTGERKPMAFAETQPLKGLQFDDVFTNLTRGADGRASFWLEGRKQRVTVSYGPKFPVGVIFAPQRGAYVCFEPMAGLTNAFNLAHAGQYPDLQSISPGGTWKESFWIKPTGF